MMSLSELVELFCDKNPGSQGPPLALVGYDVDRIHEYVFATSKPMEIAGASLIVAGLDSLVNEITTDEGLEPEAICFATGGTGLMLAPQTRAQALCDSIENRFREVSVSGSCTAAMVPVDRPAPDDSGWFSAAFTRLSAALRRRKDERATNMAGWQAIPGYLLRCQSCGRFPATREDGRYEGDEKHVCPSCLAKREACRSNSRTSDLEQARDLTDLVRRKDGTEDALAVIYCDARDMGSRLEKSDWAKAQEVSNAIRDTLLTCLAKAQENAGKGHYLDLLAGGDDLLIVVPAPRALAALRAMRDEFHAGLDDRLSPCPRLDIGLLVADCHLPAKYLFEYARRLMRSAKSHGYELADALDIQDDAIDWMVIKGGSPLNQDIGVLRQEHLSLKIDGGRSYRLTRKPYCWEDFDRLLKHKAVFSDLPGSQRKTLASYLLEHPEVARLNIAYQAARNRDVAGALENCGVKKSEAWSDHFVHESNGDYDTGYFDLLELLELEG
jgi:hypothetical protein